MKPASTLLPLALLFLPLTLAAHGAPAEGDPQKNRVIEFAPLHEPGESFTLPVPHPPLAIYETRSAKRLMGKFSPGHRFTVLAMDRYGLRVRGKTRHGPLTGWVGRSEALEADKKKLEVLASFYERQLAVESLIDSKQPATGMTIPELTRIFGTAPSQNIVADGKASNRTATWTMTRKFDIGKAAGLENPSPLFEIGIETGRVTATFENGSAKSIDLNLQDAPPEIASVPPPIAPPFQKRREEAATAASDRR